VPFCWIGRTRILQSSALAAVAVVAILVGPTSVESAVSPGISAAVATPNSPFSTAPVGGATCYTNFRAPLPTDATSAALSPLNTFLAEFPLHPAYSDTLFSSGVPGNQRSLTMSSTVIDVSESGAPRFSTTLRSSDWGRADGGPLPYRHDDDDLYVDATGWPASSKLTTDYFLASQNRATPRPYFEPGTTTEEMEQTLVTDPPLRSQPPTMLGFAVAADGDSVLSVVREEFGSSVWTAWLSRGEIAPVLLAIDGPSASIEAAAGQFYLGAVDAGVASLVRIDADTGDVSAVPHALPPSDAYGVGDVTPDGRYLSVAVRSGSDTTWYRVDAVSGATLPLSVRSDGAVVFMTSSGQLSDDGNLFAFQYSGPFGANSREVYLRDVSAATTVTLSSDGLAVAGAGVSTDGRYVYWGLSESTGMMIYDRDTGSRSLSSLLFGYQSTGIVSDNGVYWALVQDPGSSRPFELRSFTNPEACSSLGDEAADADGDGVPNGDDLCPDIVNPGQEDWVGAVAGGPDGVGDACDGVDRLKIVALGDSFMSGEGAEASGQSFLPETVRNTVVNNDCRRAETAYPVSIAQAHSAQLVFAACSGATTANILTKAQHPEDPVSAAATLQTYGIAENYGDRPQIQVLEDNSDADAVLVMIGGNDVPFTGIVANCLALGCDAPLAKAIWLWRAGVIESYVDDVLAEIQRITQGNAEIYAFTYPNPIDPSSQCGSLSGLSAAEREFLANQLLPAMNDSVRRAADRRGAYVVETTTGAFDAFRGGRICENDAARRFAHGEVIPGPFMAGYKNSFHPTPLGHDQLFRVFEEQYGSLVGNRGPRTDTSGTPVPPTPQPEVYVRHNGLAVLQGGAEPTDQLVSVNSLTVSVGSLMPGTAVRLEVRSDPVSLQEGTVDPNGEASFDLAGGLPVPAGIHSLVVIGTDGDGGNVEVHQQVRVFVANPLADDADADTVLDHADNCPGTPNTEQADGDGDGLGDACDPTLSVDTDLDAVVDEVDNCPTDQNLLQGDVDLDGVGDVCDLTDDRPRVTPGGLGGPEGDVGTTVAMVPIRLDTPWPETVSVDWYTFDTGAPGLATADIDYVATSGTARFAPFQTTTYVPIEVIGDTVYEPPLFLGEWLPIAFAENSANAVVDRASFFGIGLLIIGEDDPLPN
jgi:GDSL-like Lipase/Acylhydrolase family/Thrombospondin type 3 repeat